MTLCEQGVRPLDSAIVDYCCAFFGKTLANSWQELPTHGQYQPYKLLDVKDYFLAALTNHFLAGEDVEQLLAVQPLWQAGENLRNMLDAFEVGLVRKCTEDCAKHLMTIHHKLDMAQSYNAHAFDPRSLMAYMLVAVKQAGLSRLVGISLCHAFIKRMGARIGVFYSTLEDVVAGYITSLQTQADRPCKVVDDNTERCEYSLMRASEAAQSVESLIHYTQRFYTTKLYGHSTHPILHSLFQCVYATLLCYIRDCHQDVQKKSEIMRQLLQELYALTELDDAVDRVFTKQLEPLFKRLSQPEPYQQKTLLYVCDQLRIMRKAMRERPLYSSYEEPKATATQPSHYERPAHFDGHPVKGAMADADTNNVFYYTQSIVTQALQFEAKGEVAHFIDRYWRHVLLVAGLQKGLDGEAWAQAESLMRALMPYATLASADDVIKHQALKGLASIGKSYLSFNDFLEQENFVSEDRMYAYTQGDRPLYKH